MASRIVMAVGTLATLISLQVNLPLQTPGNAVSVNQTLIIAQLDCDYVNNPSSCQPG
ncbi:hypothetical protein IQ268_11730 [Oculatella sp. LEGE 06141]|uniref:hypothetical protein n=1 Tax=Oculatella sp. LEGE 06141 TaxID=1828648 RepID=UPI00187F1178|nr:hypothetical protein [Oculatella sp. LEGE 06141]MBE9179232.1 hypothetical protein [Oculatella sp. LEGE 06141]